jgi:DNA primase
VAVEKLSIEDVLTHYGATNVPTSLRWRAIKCPFHEDRSASASVSTDQGRFKCFACDINGDGLDIIQSQEGLDFVGAVEFAENILGASVGTLLPGRQVRARRNRLSEEPGAVRGQRAIVPARSRRRPITGA